jgi:hypothetical protein
LIRVLDVREVSYPDSSLSDSSDNLDMAVTLLMAVMRLQKRPIAVRGCTDRCERKGERERDLRINGGAIIESVYAYAPIMAGRFGAN